ncbi:MAG: hypothetical protein JWN49_370 [Parcubacteria group bacterium]|nr:hypothetical protein [Parcubacteria group bacterium]
MKRFLEWIRIKSALDAKLHRAPHVSEGDVWWINLGENVGHELNGKSKIFSRPTIIYIKLSHNFYFVIPATTKLHDGNWYVHYVHQGQKAAACLHQARSIDYRRLHRKMGRLDDTDFARIKQGFKSLYGT